MQTNNLCMLIISAVLGCLILNSCTAYKKLPYLTNVAQGDTVTSLIRNQGVHEPLLKPNDILSIVVNSNIPGAANDFNLPVLPGQGASALNPTTVNANSVSGTSGTLQNYLIDRDGNIDFPILGKVQVANMTPLQLKDYLTEQIYPKYITQRPTVTVRLLNFKVSVLGEVTKPGTFQSETGEMSIFDALAAAGDLTIYGRRDNVMLIRTDEKGNVETYRINLQDKNSVANRNIYWLQQNDKLYVEINKAKANNSAIGSETTIGLSLVGMALSVATLIISIVK